ncbi:MAG TPA: Rieske 2Fe-2S domain-containing protein [Chloroflexota bacterium]|nr:Rieske 2Fe-2S domain-containing protein [Chloroflexota bacterium]
MNPYQDFAHTGPGTLAGRYLRTFWQPVYVSSKLEAGRAVPIRVMSEDFTLYRGEGGAAHMVAPRCAHRGTQLSTGWVEGDCIRCFYHGWKYDASGQCVEMPAEEASFPAKVRIRSYPTQEYLGLVFAYLGEGEAPELPRYADFEGEGVLEAFSYVRACNFFNNVENQADPVHVAFVHRTSPFTEAGLVGVPHVSAQETDYGIELRAERASGVRVSSLLMPTLINLKGSPEEAGESGWRDTLAWRVPIDDQSHQSFNVSLTHLGGQAAERYRARKAAAPDLSAEVEELGFRWLRGEISVADVKDHPAIVNIQDNVAQIGQGAIADRENERLGRSDAGIILLRRIWERELRALAEGRPLKRWRPPARVATTAGV